jgi:mRNA interferase MazF
MGPFTKGDIVLFPFPYTDLTNRKLRPCLVITEEMGEDLILCQITSSRLRIDQYAVEIKHDETIGGSLQIDSLIRANMIFTASKAQIQRRVCRIDDKRYKEVVGAILKLISR